MEEKIDLTLEYIHYSHSEQVLAQYCKENNLNYLEFVEVANRWNDRYGAPLVEKCMTDLNGLVNGQSTISTNQVQRRRCSEGW